jgi:hypothetical protein
MYLFIYYRAAVCTLVIQIINYYNHHYNHHHQHVMLWRPFYPRGRSLRAQVVPSDIV